MEIHSVIITHAGKIAENNEDNFYFDGNWRNELGASFFATECIKEKENHLFAVCDGMGGEAEGEVASWIAVSRIEKYRELICNFADFNSAARKYVGRVNELLLKRQKEIGNTTGTTLALLAIHKNKGFICSVGDSRIYRFTNDKLEQLTVDHTVGRVLESLGIQERGMGKRASSGNQLLQFLGMPEDEMVLEPDIRTELPINKGDIYVLCSDGLTDYVNNEDLLKILQSPDALSQMAKNLLERALIKGGKDNITILLVEAK